MQSPVRITLNHPSEVSLGTCSPLAGERVFFLRRHPGPVVVRSVCGSPSHSRRESSHAVPVLGIENRVFHMLTSVLSPVNICLYHPMRGIARNPSPSNRGMGLFLREDAGPMVARLVSGSPSGSRRDSWHAVAVLGVATGLFHMLTSSLFSAILMTNHPRERSLGTRPPLAGDGSFFHLPSGHRSLRSQSPHRAPVNRTRFRRYSQSPRGETILELRHASTTPRSSVQSRLAIRRHIYWRSRASPGQSRPALSCLTVACPPRTKFSTPAGPSPTLESSRPVSSAGCRIPHSSPR